MALHHKTAAKYLNNLMKAIAAVAAHHIEQGVVFVAVETDEETKRDMSGTLLKYRGEYVPATSYNGNPSLNNGDTVAEVLEGMSPDEVCFLADLVFSTEQIKHIEKYQGLNPGQRRMNAGNRIRAAVRRGDITVEEVRAMAGKRE